MNWSQQPHRRWNPLTRQWILVSPQRTQRPWLGELENTPRPCRVEYDPDCYLCPGNTRAGGARNPQYRSTFVFDNDYAALLPDTPDAEFDQAGLLRAQSEKGICRVLCFSPNHSLTLARMEMGEIRTVVDAWCEQYADLGSKPFISSVQIFENRGEMMGASNPHPHCQIWADERLPNELAAEQLSLQDHRVAKTSCLLCDYLKLELASAERLVCQNDGFAAVVPFWAVWPFEALIVSKQHLTGIDQLDGKARDAFADILKRLTTRGDNLFQAPFPYTMGIHQRPTDGAEHLEWHLHLHWYPPLLRSATVRKFMVGYELLGMPQRDITPESAAERLRSLPELHYLSGAR
ncbi:MAG TPA: UDP-glucose--hexose-1-phosphate uridylyltransferase [Bryobacteraceae bacterium]|nr:UDP-glucose--hexose-1-phosphate uridylyltransferase [Bryobacteraceae bacterium]